MHPFRFFCFGSFTVHAEAKPVTELGADKARALLAYLVLEPNRTHDRSYLIGLFWADYPQTDALRSLRNSLYRLRQQLEKATPNVSKSLLTITRQSLQLNADGSAIDVLHFEQLLDEVAEHKHGGIADCSTCLGKTAEAAALYRGELLAGMGVDDAPVFEEWLLAKREQLHLRALLALQTLTHAYEERSDDENAYRFASQWLRLEPYQETALRALMRIAARRGLSDQAIVQYNRTRQLLRDEMGIEPSEQTIALMQQIATGNFEEASQQQGALATNVAPALFSSPQYRKSPLHNVPQSEPFFGRNNELGQLEQWFINEDCRVVALLGIGGIGKTSIAAQFTHRMATHFEAVLWQSLLNAPPPIELFPLLLRSLAQVPHSGLPESIDAQLQLLIEALQERKVLLVLDNCESILAPDEASLYRAGYEVYGQLISAFATYGHQSHLLLTSREQPQGFTRLVKDSPLVQSLRLDGLDDGAGHQLLVQRGLREVDHQATTLIERYSGNPLALKLVADTVDELFAGDINEFLESETLVFDDIRDVLDQQYVRLSALEKELLIWLAVMREPMLLPEIRSCLLAAPPQRNLMEAISNLQRRSLIERNQIGFGLQNVITEYLTDRFIEAAFEEIQSGQFVLLHQHAALRTNAKEYVRQSQARLILAPLSQSLAAMYGTAQLTAQLQTLVKHLHKSLAQTPSYTPGNLINLLLHMEMDISAYDFSGLNIREAYLKGKTIQGVNFTEADFANSVFTDDFGNVHATAFSPDGEILAAGTKEGIIRLWRRQDGQLQRTLSTEGKSIWWLEYSPDGQLLASASSDHYIRLWDLQTGALHQTLKGHAHAVRVVAFSPDGQQLVSSSNDSTIRLWNVDGPAIQAQELHVLDEDTGPSFGVAFSPDGRAIAGSTKDGSIRLWDASSAKLIRSLVGHAAEVESMAFSPDGLWLVSGDHACQVMLWEVATGRLCHTLAGHTDRIKSVDFHVSSRLFASGSADQTVRIWDVDNGLCRHRLEAPSAVWNVRFSPNGESVICGGLDYRLNEWDVETGQLRHVRHGHTNTAMCLTYSKNGKTLVTGHSDGEVCMWNVEPAIVDRLEAEAAETIAPMLSIHLRRIVNAHHGWVTAVALSQNGESLATSGLNGEVRLWDAETGALKSLLHKHDGSVFGCVFSPSDALLASAGADGVAHIWDVQSGQRRHSLQTSNSALERVIFTPDGNLLITSGAAPHAQIWHLSAILNSGTTVVSEQTMLEHSAVLGSPASDDTWVDGAVCRQAHGHGDMIFALATNQDGSMLATGSYDLTLCLWDLPAIAKSNTDGTAPDANTVKQRALRHVLKGHTGWIWSTAFSPDGTTLASCSEDRTIRLWDVRSGEETMCLQGHNQFVFALAFSPDGRTIASGSGDKTIRFWDVATGRCIKILRKPGPYEGMDITGATGLTDAQKVALRALGAVER